MRLRELQDETGGIPGFIPLAFHPENTPLADLPASTGQLDLRVIAVSRLMLDNVPHIKAYWIQIGTKLAQVALFFGADDLVGTVVDETITHAAGRDDGVRPHAHGLRADHPGIRAGALRAGLAVPASGPPCLAGEPGPGPGVRRLLARDAARGSSLLGTGCLAHGAASKPKVAVVDGDPIVQMAKPGKMPTLDHPQYAPVKEHSDPPFRAERVVGVTLGPTSRMYPIGLLDDYEAVNDVAGGVPYVVARCPMADLTAVLDRRVSGRTLTFEVSGAHLAGHARPARPGNGNLLVAGDGSRDLRAADRANPDDPARAADDGRGVGRGRAVDRVPGNGRDDGCVAEDEALRELLDGRHLRGRRSPTFASRPRSTSSSSRKEARPSPLRRRS